MTRSLRQLVQVQPLCRSAIRDITPFRVLPEGVRILHTDCVGRLDDKEGLQITDIISESKVKVKYT